MIASFFQSLESQRVAYLLISGQATVLYGAATFSEDIDLWIEPSPDNVELFRIALREVNARYYKLTPPLETRYLKGGHGFHFFLGELEGDAVFIDVMGSPPRSRDFAAALQGSRSFQTDWGILPTIGLRDLIELKKTQRLADYPVVSALTLRLLEESSISGEILAWAASHLFTVESFFFFNERYPQWVEAPPSDLPSSLLQVAGHQAEEISDSIVEELSRWMAAAMSRHQLADRRYWRGIISELRQMRNNKILLTDGTPV